MKRPAETMYARRLPDGSQYASGDPARLTDAEAQVLGEQIERMSGDGIPVTPARIVLRAKDPSSPLHKHFEWNNGVAAEEHRKEQARRLIQSLEIVTVERTGPRRTPAHYSIERTADQEPLGKAAGKKEEIGNKGGAATEKPKPRQEYLSVQKAREQPLAREQVFAQAVKELRQWAHKYEAFGLEELASVYEAAARFSK